MNARRIVLRWRQRDRLLRLARACRDPLLRVRYLIVVHSADGWGIARISEALGCCASTVSRTRRRWRRRGESGLADGRADNGRPKVNERYLTAVRRVLRGTPQDFGHRRPTWTLDLLVRAARRQTRRTVSVTTMGRVLARLGARRGRPKPVAPCPWSKRRKNQRLAMIRRLIGSLPADQAALWLDEVQLDLNPRVGYDWMLPGTQRRLHFLPPYCPDDNRIERRAWRELHQNVTVNHRHDTIESLMHAVTRWIDSRNRHLSQSRKVI